MNNPRMAKALTCNFLLFSLPFRNFLQIHSGSTPGGMLLTEPSGLPTGGLGPGTILKDGFTPALITPLELAVKEFHFGPEAVDLKRESLTSLNQSLLSDLDLDFSGKGLFLHLDLRFIFASRVLGNYLNSFVKRFNY